VLENNGAVCRACDCQDKFILTVVEFRARTKERLLFNYPFGILAAVGLMRLSQTKGKRLKSIIPVFIALALLAYQLRSLANLV